MLHVHFVGRMCAKVLEDPENLESLVFWRQAQKQIRPDETCCHRV